LPNRIFVQVGGGALASALFSGLEEAALLRRIPALPRLYPVQTQGAFPLVRAYEKLVSDLERARGLAPLDDADARAERLRDVLGESGIETALREAAQRRAEYMWPWEETPKSLAHGILDDETYDWLGVLRGTLLSAGHPVLVAEDDVRAAHELGRKATGIDVCPTGTASLAGLLTAMRKNPALTRERVLLPFTGKRR
jgi:threonine synthase